MITEKALTVVNKIENCRGRFVTITGKRQLDLKKKYQKENPTDVFHKESVFQLQSGIKYDNMKVVKEKRENGELPVENAGLRGMSLVEGYQHLRKSDKTGKLYLTGRPMSSGKKVTTFYKNGVVIPKEEVIKLNCCLSKDIKSSTNSSDWLLYQIDCVTDIK